jgi:hypothetical protein
MASHIERRKFLATLGGAAAWPLAARAQQVERIRRVGVLLSIAETDPDAQRRIQVFQQGLEELGWTEGRNIRVEYRFGAGDSDRIAKEVTDLVALKPDVIVGNSTPVVVALRQATRSIPIIFVQIIDPVGSGLVETLARPGGNMTGFSDFEFGTSSKWLELLKEIAPNATQAAVLLASDLASSTGLLRVLEDVAPVGWRAVDAGASARCRGDQAGTGQLRASIEWRSDRAAESPDSGPSRHDHCARGTPSAVRGLSVPLLRAERWLVILWCGQRRPLPARRLLCRSNPQGYQSCGPARAAADQV